MSSNNTPIKKCTRFCSFFLLVLFLFAFIVNSNIYASAIDWPIVRNMGNFFTVQFVDNSIISFIYADDVYVENSTGNVYIIKPTSISNYKTYEFDRAYRHKGYPNQLVFNLRGEYLPIISNLKNPDYDARYDSLLFKYADLLPQVYGDITVEMIRPADIEDGGSERYEKTLSYSDAQIERNLVYNGRTYTRVSWKPFQSYEYKVDYYYTWITFTLRFEDVQTYLLQGYQTLRDVSLTVNSYITDCRLDLYHLQMIEPNGNRYTLYFDDVVYPNENTIDNEISYLADCEYAPGTLFEFSYEATPPGTGSFDTTDEVVLNVYNDAFISLSSQNEANDINMQLLTKRTEEGIRFQYSQLQYLEEQYNSIYTPTIDNIESVDDLLNSENDFGFLNNFLRWDSPILTNFVALATISLCFATIGFALYGKKGG